MIDCDHPIRARNLADTRKLGIDIPPSSSCFYCMALSGAQEPIVPSLGGKARPDRCHCGPSEGARQ